ncbi:hypothetical protein F5Y18DRAFT_402945 [Xylariaceae sp. FL1019]|nr:hypothetical protein F5Y18DRAFT_402945 [Xylariaceae sp. FL1019]
MSPTTSSTTLPPEQPPLPQRMTSSLIMGLAQGVSRAFLYGLNSVEVTGLQRFLEVLDQRKDIEKRERGLITVSNHVSIVDDPLIWGVLPFNYGFSPSNLRWSLGAHDICFKNRPLNALFTSGQVLPTHRLQHSDHGGLFQPTMTQAIRLLSAQPFHTHPAQTVTSSSTLDIPDPFTNNHLTYYASPPPSPIFPAPSAYAQNRHAWIHIFPEACVHQHPDMHMRYYKWGISRLILEAEPMPDVLPMFIDGPQKVMSEDRTFPRFVPRAGKQFRIGFGELLDMEERFGDLRKRWRELVVKDTLQESQTGALVKGKWMGDLSDELKYGDEATKLRIEVARRVREEVAKVRRSMGYPEEPDGLEDADTWKREDGKERFRSNVDDGLVNKKQ